MHTEPELGYMALGFAGVLYPPSFIHQDLYITEKIKKLSYTADDLWLMVMEILSDTKVVIGDFYGHPMIIPSSQTISLKAINNAVESRNNACLENLEDEYKFSEKLYK